MAEAQVVVDQEIDHRQPEDNQLVAAQSAERHLALAAQPRKGRGQHHGHAEMEVERAIGPAVLPHVVADEHAVHEERGESQAEESRGSPQPSAQQIGRLARDSRPAALDKAHAGGAIARRAGQLARRRVDRVGMRQGWIMGSHFDRRREESASRLSRAKPRLFYPA